MENQHGTRNKQKRYRQRLFVTDAGSQLTFEMGEGGGAGISKNVTNAGGVTTDLLGV